MVRSVKLGGEVSSRLPYEHSAGSMRDLLNASAMGELLLVIGSLLLDQLLVVPARRLVAARSFSMVESVSRISCIQSNLYISILYICITWLLALSLPAQIRDYGWNSIFLY